MRFILLVCAVLLSGCASNETGKPDFVDAVGAALPYSVFGNIACARRNGGAPCRDGRARTIDVDTQPRFTNPASAGHENDGLHSYWSPQTGPVTCNTFGSFTNCN